MASTRDKVYVDIIADSKKAVSNIAKLSLAGIGVAKAFQLAEKVITESFEAFKVQEQATTRLDAALRATSGAVGITRTEMDKMSASLDSLTTFSDQAITNAQGLLVTFTNIGKDVFPQALEAALDLSSMFGQDLKQSSIQLGKALNDPIRGMSALADTGIVFSDVQRELITLLQESGDIMGAQTVILDELEREFGGVALAAGKDGVAGVAQLSNAFVDLKEQAGRMLSRVGGPIITWLKDVVQEAAEAQAEINALADSLLTLATEGAQAFTTEAEVLRNIEVIEKAILASEEQRIEALQNRNRIAGTAARLANESMINNEAEVGILNDQLSALRVQLTVVRMQANVEETARRGQARADEARLQQLRDALDLQRRQNELLASAQSIITNELSERDKIIAQIEYLNTLQLESGKGEEQRVEAIAILRQALEDLTQDEIDNLLEVQATRVALGLATKEEEEALEKVRLTRLMDSANRQLEIERGAAQEAFDIAEQLIDDEMALADKLANYEQVKREEQLEKQEEQNERLIELEEERVAAKILLAELEAQRIREIKEQELADLIDSIHLIIVENRVMLDELQEMWAEYEAARRASQDWWTDEFARANKDVIDLMKGFYRELENFIELSSDNQLNILKEKLEKGQITEEEYADKKKQLLLEQARAEKAMAIFSIAISTAVSIMKFLETGNIGASIAAGILGVIQAGVVLATPVPSFAQGGSFETNGEQLIRVGDNAGGRERVTVEPLSSNGSGDSGMVHTVIMLDSEVLYDAITKGSRDGRLRINSRSIRN